MNETTPSLSDIDRHSLFEACTREAQRIGGDERTAEYFFVRAQTSRVWMSSQGTVTVADMDLADWCGAIAWSAPGITRRLLRSEKKDGTGKSSGKRATERKQPRSGAHFRRHTT